jgi:hypothetical protein
LHETPEAHAGRLSLREEEMKELTTKLRSAPPDQVMEFLEHYWIAPAIRVMPEDKKENKSEMSKIIYSSILRRFDVEPELVSSEIEKKVEQILLFLLAVREHLALLKNRENAQNA